MKEKQHCCCIPHYMPRPIVVLEMRLDCPWCRVCRRTAALACSCKYPIMLSTIAGTSWLLSSSLTSMPISIHVNEKSARTSAAWYNRFFLAYTYFDRCAVAEDQKFNSSSAICVCDRKRSVCPAARFLFCRGEISVWQHISWGCGFCLLSWFANWRDLRYSCRCDGIGIGIS